MRDLLHAIAHGWKQVLLLHDETGQSLVSSTMRHAGQLPQIGSQAIRLFNPLKRAVFNPLDMAGMLGWWQTTATQSTLPDAYRPKKNE